MHKGIIGKWEKALKERYGHVQYISGRRKTKKEKRRRNLGVKAKKIWMQYWRESIPKGYEIHHVDGNNLNNNICNLALVTIEYHDDLHKEFGKRKWRKNNG